MRIAKHYYLVGISCGAFSAAAEIIGAASITTQVAFPVVGAIFLVGGAIIDAISELRTSNVVNRAVVNRVVGNRFVGSRQDMDRQ